MKQGKRVKDQDNNKLTAKEIERMLEQVVKNGQPMSIELHHPGNRLDAFSFYITKKRVDSVEQL